jgi:hypothetical protein
MKSNIFTITLLGSAIVLSGCASKFETRKTLDGIPKKYQNADIDEGVGYGRSNELDVSQAVSMNNALGDLCMKTSANVEAETRSTSVQTGKGAQDKAARRDVVMVTSKCNVTVKGSEKEQETILVEDDNLLHTFTMLEPESVTETTTYEFKESDLGNIIQAENN